jgi:hypothetical protein
VGLENADLPGANSKDNALDSHGKRETKNGKRPSASEGRHFLAQDATKLSPGKGESNGQSPVGTAQLGKRETKNEKPIFGKPETGNGKPIHRITIPKELEDLIKGEPDPNISDDELMRLAAEMFNIKTG